MRNVRSACVLCVIFYIGRGGEKNIHTSLVIYHGNTVMRTRILGLNPRKLELRGISKRVQRRTHLSVVLTQTSHKRRLLPHKSPPDPFVRKRMKLRLVCVTMDDVRPMRMTESDRCVRRFRQSRNQYTLSTDGGYAMELL